MQTKFLINKAYVKSYASVAGPIEGNGKLKNDFDLIIKDPLAGEKTWESAESSFQKTAVKIALKKKNIDENAIDNILAGDLVNQCTVSSFAARSSKLPYIGLYGACSTSALNLGVGALFVSAAISNNIICVTSSHFCSAERTYRFPVEYGGQRTMSAQHTVTAAGATILSNEQNPIYIDAVTFGKVVDMGITDATNMGAAMAPAAADTLTAFFNDSNTKPYDYDAIFTGDLGKVGSELLYKIMNRNGLEIENIHKDCGLLIYDMNNQDVHAGGSGCGCAASVLNGHIFKNMENDKYKNILFCATGALLSPVSSNQGESIPSIAHLLNIRKN